MVGRLLVRVSGVLLAIGMWVAVLAGAGAAAAAPNSESGASDSGTSASTESAGSGAATSDAGKPSAGTPTPGTQATPGNDATQTNTTSDTDSTTTGSTADTPTETPTPSDESGNATSSEGDDDTVATDTASPPTDDPAGTPVVGVGRQDTTSSATRLVAPPRVRSLASVPAPQDAQAKGAQTGDTPAETGAVVTDSAQPVPSSPTAASSITTFAAQPDVTSAESTAAVLAIAAPAYSPATAPSQPSVLDLVGTVVFSVLNIGFSLFAGPPQLPPGSTVMVRSSTLELRPGEFVPADWYVPQNPDPDRLIYFQHGFIVNASPYSYTIAALAENTNSIVVAPSITSNFFATDGFWLAGTPVQQAVANLFTGDREALAVSLSAAFGPQVTLPQDDVVFAGHSYGAATVLGAAARMVDDDAIDDPVGIVLFDGVPTDAIAVPALAKLPASIPVYNIASPPSFFSDFGRTSAALVNARPGEFVGVQVVNGSHVDSMQGGNPLIQLAGNLATGVSRPENIEAVKILASGWINDMFAGTSSGIYSAPGATIQIPTSAGTATVTALPAPNPPLGLFDLLVIAIGDSVVARFFNFEPTEGPLVLF